MSRKFHGVSSVALAGLAIVLAAVALFRFSWVVGAIYLAGLAIGALLILWSYCAKCAGKDDCAHVLPGWVAAKFNRPAGPYTTVEFRMISLGLALLLVLPQIWLWRSPGLLVAFWLLLGIAFLQIRRNICCNCGNVNCPMRIPVQIDDL